MPRRYRFSDVLVDPQAFRVLKGGVPISLEPKSLNVLVLLIERRGQLVEKRELIDVVWGGAFVTDNALTRVIAQLRKALGDDAKESRYIETVPTRGYRFIFEVIIEESAVADPAALETSSTSSSTPGLAGPSVDSKPRWEPRTVVAFGSLSLVLLVLTGIGLMRWTSQSKVLQIANNTQITTGSSLFIYPTFSPDGTSLAYSAERNGSFEIFIRQLTLGGEEVQVTSDGKQNFQAAWSPDGKFLAYYSQGRGGIWLIPALGGTARRLTDFGSHPSWSHDGRWIGFQSGDLSDYGTESTGVFSPSAVWIAKADGSDARAITRAGTPEGGHGAPSWSPDGKHVAFVATNYGSSELWCTAVNGTAPVQLSAKTIGYFDPIFSQDGSSVIFGKAPSGLWQVRISSSTCAPLGEPVLISDSGGGRIKNLTWSSDGKKLAYASVHVSSELSSLSVTPSAEPVGEPSALISSTDCRTSVPVFSPDGSHIAYISCRGGAPGQIWIMNADGTGRLQITSDAERGAVLPTWFPDGRRLLYVQHNNIPRYNLQSLDVDTRQSSLVTEFPTDPGKPQLSPDGSQLAISPAANGVINIWLMDMTTRKLRQLTFDKQMIGFPAWSPDGKLLAAELRRGEDDHLVLIDAATGQLQEAVHDHAKNWVNSWSQDGDKLIYAKFDAGGVWNIWSYSRSTGIEKRLTHYSDLNGYVRYPTISPRGNQIVYEHTITAGNIWMMEFK